MKPKVKLTGNLVIILAVAFAVTFSIGYGIGVVHATAASNCISNAGLLTCDKFQSNGIADLTCSSSNAGSVWYSTTTANTVKYCDSSTVHQLLVADTAQTITGALTLNANPVLGSGIGITWGGTTGNLGSATAYPAIVYTNALTGEGSTPTISGFSIAYSQLTTFPTGCAAGNYVSAVGSTLTCGTAAVTVSNSDGTLTISPTSGAVVASIALGHANTWTAQQSFSAVVALNSGNAIRLYNPANSAYASLYMDANSVVQMNYQMQFAANGIVLAGPGVGKGTFAYANSASSATLTFPAFTDTLAVLGSTQTFTGAITMNALTLGGAVTGGGQNLNALGNLAFNADNTQTIATATNRLASVSSVLYNVYHASADANPSAQLGDGFVKFGAGGATGLQYTIGYSTAFATANPSIFITSATATLSLALQPYSGSNTNFIALFRTNDVATNAEWLEIGSDRTGVSTFGINVRNLGTGTLRPFVIDINSIESARVLTSGAWQFTTGTINLNAATTTLNANAVNILWFTSTGFQVGANSANNAIWTASQGTGSTTLYIGNAAIVVQGSTTFTLGAGGNTVYRCTVAGNLRVGQLTTVSADCGSVQDTGLRTP